MTTTQNLSLLLGRIFFSIIFILSGVNKIFAFNNTMQYMQHAGMVDYTNILLIIAIVFELGGGLLLLFGFFTRIGAWMILIFSVVVSFGIHHFWSYPADQAQLQMIMFLKNLVIIGGTLYIITFGAGEYSIDGKRKR